ncbi:MAG: alpha/beta hydrolase [Myxococcales bacterium]|nr:alpha/beta hydrolase [Myxococcales bacterium]
MTARVTANGLDFAYLEQGSGPLVLFVHGFPDTAHTWDGAMRAAAAAGFRAVAPFTRGYHPTAIPSDGAYDTDTLGRDVVALIEALGEDRAIVVGHDWGANAAYAAAATAPERVRLLVTVAIPHPGSIKPTPGMLWNLRHFATLRRAKAPERVRANDFALLDELWRRWSPAWKDIPPAETAAVKQAFQAPGSLEAALGYYKAIRVKLPASLRQKITVPTVAFAGEHDMITPRAYEKARHWFTASYEVCQVPGGHFMHREHPEAFNTELVRVLHDKGGARLENTGK